MPAPQDERSSRDAAVRPYALLPVNGRRRCLIRLSWNEVRTRAAAFADEWGGTWPTRKARRGASYNDFFEVFGVRRRTVARHEARVAKLDDRSGFIDPFWPGVLTVEQKSAGRDLGKAYGQAGEYFDALPERSRPRYILASDFQTFELHDLDEREVVSFALAELPGNAEAFDFVLGVQRRTFRDQDPANTDAAGARRPAPAAKDGPKRAPVAVGPDDQWRTRRIPTEKVIGWLHPDGEANRRRDRKRFPATLDAITHEAEWPAAWPAFQCPASAAWRYFFPV